MILSEEDPYAKDQVEDQSHFGSHPILTSYAGNLTSYAGNLKISENKNTRTKNKNTRCVKQT